MTTGNWVQRDQLRESWIFLLLGTPGKTEPENKESPLQYWECGVGNADRVVETETAQVGCGNIDTESELLTELLSQLGQYRYQDTAIITRTEETIQTLRRRIALHETEVMSLRGLSHICVENLLIRYFSQTLADQQLDQDALSEPRTTTGQGTSEVVSTGGVQEFWQAWQRLYQLLPADELSGDKL